MKDNNELMHYGVLGMRWGIRKDYTAKTDHNAHVHNSEVRKAMKDRRSGAISREEYKKRRKKATNKWKAANAKAKSEANAAKKMKPKKGASVSSIYAKSERRAHSRISNYRGKRIARSVVKGAVELRLAAEIAEVTVASIATGVAAPVLGAAVATAVAKDLPYKLAIKHVSKQMM